MSGPKVIRVVSREELVETCTALLRQLDRAIKMWTREGKRLESLETAEVAPVQKMREVLAACLADGRFAEIQQRVPEEIAFLSRDLEQRRELAAEAAARALQQARRQRENAATLLRELQRYSLPDQTDLLSALEQIAAGTGSGGDTEAVLAKGFRLLTDRGISPGLSDAQRNLAKQLAPDEDGRAFEDWKRLRTRLQDIRLQDIDRRLAELEVYLGTEATAVFSIRMRAIEAEPPEGNTNMRIDALVLDLAAAVRILKEETASLFEASDLAAELASANTAQDDSVTALHTKLKAAIDAKDFVSLPDMIKAGRAALSGLLQIKAAEARRAAILSGLSALGYEVHEGMSTAWAKRGRVVLRKPNLPGYGVELAGASDAKRLQVRAVAFEADRDTSRDRDVETLWCDDFGKLHGLVAAKGGSIAIEKALAIGATPLKTVDVPAEVKRTEHGSKMGRTNSGH